MAEISVDAGTGATIRYKTRATGFVKDERPCYSAYVVHNGTVAWPTFRDRTARRCGYDPSVVGCVWSGFIGQLRTEFQSGNRVDLDGVAGGLNVQGMFRSLTDTWDPQRHRLVPSLAAKGALRDCLVGAEAVNVTDAPAIAVKRVMDTVAQTDGVIAGPAPVSVYVSGTNLQIDPAAEDEGCWLEDSSGVIVAVAEVTDSTLMTLDCTFAELPPAGEYRLAVAGRGGVSGGGVSIGRRKVTVAMDDDGEGDANG